VKKGDVISCVQTGATPLPVTLTAFNGSVTDGQALLKWTTAAEVNNDHFTVERSPDAENYVEIERLPGFGTTSVRHDHVFRDDATPLGMSYYRLSQTDYDGTVKHYGPIAIRKNDADVHRTKPVVYPNPFNNSFTYS